MGSSPHRKSGREKNAPHVRRRRFSEPRSGEYKKRQTEVRAAGRQIARELKAYGWVVELIEESRSTSVYYRASCGDGEWSFVVRVSDHPKATANNWLEGKVAFRHNVDLALVPQIMERALRTCFNARRDG